jgi:hypothetical protein
LWKSDGTVAASSLWSADVIEALLRGSETAASQDVLAGKH